MRTLYAQSEHSSKRPPAGRLPVQAIPWGWLRVPLLRHATPRRWPAPLVSALDLGAVDYGPQPDWTASGAELEGAMQRIGG